MNGLPIILAQQQPNSGASSLLIMGLFFLAFWFLLIAPQRKRQKEQEKMIASLKNGDGVMTTGGIVGVIVGTREQCVTLKTADSKIEVHRSAIQGKWNSAKSKA